MHWSTAVCFAVWAAPANEAFEAHSLVQQGMRALVHSRFDRTQTQDLAERTATILVANDQAESAFALLTEIGST